MTNLTYVSAWRSIDARVANLRTVLELHQGYLSVQRSSAYGVPKMLQRQCEQILAAVLDFKNTFERVLPELAVAAIDAFFNTAGGHIRGNAAGDDALVRSNIIMIVGFAAEMAYALDNPLERVRSASELAFMHLQRLIVADADYRRKWQDAFNDHETHCERLGGVHLLWHGIWAFKVDAIGGKTDLVFPEPPDVGAAPVAIGMVMTEWKRATGDAAKAFAEARAQADLYANGIVAGLELASHRYLVVVTKTKAQSMPDISENGIVYRHINIVVDPASPSITARRSAT